VQEVAAVRNLRRKVGAAGIAGLLRLRLLRGRETGVRAVDGVLAEVLARGADFNAFIIF